MDDLEFLNGGGEMGARMRAHDWSTSPLKPPADWPQSLRSVVGLMINSRYPMFCAWGPDLAFLYNDGYIPIFGAKHPHTLGRPFRDVWSEIWDDVSPMVESALAGVSTYHEDLHLVMERNGFPEDTWYDFSYSPVRDEDGVIAGMFCACHETTGRVLSDRKLRESERTLQSMANALPALVAFVDTDHRYQFCNRAYEQWFGRNTADIIGHHVRDLVGDEAYQKVLPQIERALGGESFSFETLLPYAQGPHRFVHVEYLASRAPDGTIDGYYALITDISEQQRAADMLRESEARFRNMADHSPVMMWVTEPNGHCSYLNRSWYDFTGQEEQEALGFGWLEAVHPDDSAEAERVFRHASEKAAAFRIEYRLRRADGVYRWAIDAAQPRFDSNGQFLGYIGSVIEIDERRRFEALQVAQNSVLERALEAPSIHEPLEALVAVIESESGGEVLGSILLTDGDGHLRHGAAPSLPEEYNQAIDGIAIGHGVGSCGTAAHTGKAVFVSDIANDPLWAEFKDLAAEHGLGACWSIPILSTEDAVLGTFAMYYREPREPNDDDLRLVDYVTRTASLIIERDHVSSALRRSSEEFSMLADNIPALAWMAHADGSIFWYNRRWYEFTGTTPETQIGWGWESVHHPGTLEAVVRRWTTSLEKGESFEMTFPLRNQHGEYRSFLTRAVPIRDAAGEVVRWFGTNVDINPQVAAERALTALNETLESRVSQEVERRTTAENALYQSQKIETLGQLTGGVAHDFNNLLTPIVGALDVAQKSLEGDQRAHRLVSGAIQAADRARILVQRLLAFSRRQHLQPKAVDVAALVHGISDLIHRSIGPHIVLKVDIDEHLGPAQVDPNQLELALLNLAVNARDAMPEGGTLTISARADRIVDHDRLTDGDYIRIAVVDSGSGMNDNVLRRAIEPFFTTKDIGQGTGLGLSSVQGLALQSGGELILESVVGHGTTATLWLPLSDQQAARTDSIATVASAPPANATALLVDDEPLVRAGIAAMLDDLGYRVIEASSAAEAEVMVDSGIEFDLLITDHAMPGGNGTDLAQEMRARRPDLPVLLVTGYAKVAEDGGSGLARLSKPFRKDELARRLELLLAPAS